MEDKMEFSLIKHYPVERRYIILRKLKKSFVQSFVDAVFRKNKR